LIVAHNHPSGDPSPSPEDREVTRRLAQAGKVLGIALLDSLVIGGARHVSIREESPGLLEGV
jgi:DNA repair protein RadC